MNAVSDNNKYMMDNKLIMDHPPPQWEDFTKIDFLKIGINNKFNAFVNDIQNVALIVKY